LIHVNQSSSAGTLRIFSKAVSYAVWHPSLARAHVTVAKGIHFSAMGHSVPRPITDEDGAQKVYKRLELLPEETLYLAERGSLFCWKECNLDLSHVSGVENIPGPPMSVQQVYSELIGVEDLTLERFQVSATRFSFQLLLIGSIGLHISQTSGIFRHANRSAKFVLPVSSPVSGQTKGNSNSWYLSSSPFSTSPLYILALSSGSTRI